MLTIIAALVPVFLIIVLGAFLRRSTLFPEQIWSGFENLCYFVLFPALLVKTLATAQIGKTEVVQFSGTVLFAILTMSGLMLLLYPLLKRQGLGNATFTSLFQGATRWHGFIALSIVGILFGDEGVVYIAITMAVIIPPLNVINVTVLAMFSEKESGIRQVGAKLIRNPFILACAAGAFLNLSGMGLAEPVYQLLDILGGGALGLGLLTVGAGLRMGLILDHRVRVAFGVALRLIGMPAMMFLGAWIFDVGGVARTVAVIAAAVPTASSSYVLARQMGGDAPLMANLITGQVVAATATLPLMIWLSGGF